MHCAGTAVQPKELLAEAWEGPELRNTEAASCRPAADLGRADKQLRGKKGRDQQHLMARRPTINRAAQTMSCPCELRPFSASPRVPSDRLSVAGYR